jgi:hypothetical protein
MLMVYRAHHHAMGLLDLIRLSTDITYQSMSVVVWWATRHVTTSDVHLSC